MLSSGKILVFHNVYQGETDCFRFAVVAFCGLKFGFVAQIDHSWPHADNAALDNPVHKRLYLNDLSDL